MNRALVNPLLCAVVISVGLFLGISNMHAQGAAAPAGEAQKTAEQAFKNIQTLKGIPADQIQPTMQFISNSLGVECQFCHVQGAFEKDDKKPKLTARKMIEMQMAINKTHFNGDREITCYSCHHGAERPAGTPLIAEQEPTPVQVPIEESVLPSADQILNKYITALGGAEALQKITTRVQKGSITFGERTFPAEVLSKAPNKRVSTISTPNGDNITAYDGHAGWLGSPGRPPREMSPQEIEAASFDATFYLPLELKKMFSQFRVTTAPNIGRIAVYQVIADSPGKPPVRLFFDKVAGLLVRTIRYAETPLGRNPTQVDYTEYRPANGIKIPFEWTVARPLGRFTIEVREIEQNAPIDDAKFEKPTGVPQTEKPSAK